MIEWLPDNISGFSEESVVAEAQDYTDLSVRILTIVYGTDDPEEQTRLAMADPDTHPGLTRLARGMVTMAMLSKLLMQLATDNECSFDEALVDYARRREEGRSDG